MLTKNSARLSTRLTDPKFEHPRTYLVQVERIPDESALKQLREGVMLKDGRTRPAKVELLASPPRFAGRPCSNTLSQKCAGTRGFG